MDVQATPRAVMLERPCLGQAMVRENARKLQPQFLGDLKQEGRREAIAQEGSAVAVLVILFPDRRLTAEAAERLERRVIQKIVDERDFRASGMVPAFDGSRIKGRIEGACLKPRRRLADEYAVKGGGDVRQFLGI